MHLVSGGFLRLANRERDQTDASSGLCQRELVRLVAFEVEQEPGGVVLVVPDFFVRVFDVGIRDVGLRVDSERGQLQVGAGVTSGAAGKDGRRVTIFEGIRRVVYSTLL